MGRPRRYFTVDIYYTTGGFCSRIKLDAKIDRINSVPVTTSVLAREYAETILIRPGEGKWCSVY